MYRNYCIHEKYYPGNYYEPSEVWCDLDLDCDCANCPEFCTPDTYYEIDDYDFSFVAFEDEEF